MLLALPPTLPPAAHHNEEQPWRWQDDILWDRGLVYCDPTRTQVDSFKIGETLYRMLRSLNATFEPPIRGKKGRFVVSGVGEPFVGKGKTLDEARKDWELEIDSTVQQLFATQDFERTPEQTRQWNLLCRYFDLNETRYSSPVKIRAYGRLLSNRARRFQIRWIDGSKCNLDRNKVPDNLVSFCVGQPFEAVVLRDPRTWELLRIESAFVEGELPNVSKQEADDLLGNVPSTRNFPSLEWD